MMIGSKQLKIDNVKTFVNKKSLMDEFQEYEIIKKVGYGHQGSIYLVESKNKKQFAMKKITKYKFDSDHRLNPNSQLTLLPTLNHPNIVKTFHLQETQHQSTMILEYAENGDLNSYRTKLYQNQLIPQPVLLKWLCQLSLGLHYLHTKARVLHRDIKTKNILVMQNGIIKLADFGTAKQLMKHQQFAMTAVGTPYYLSPQAIQLSKYHSKSDIWGLGCIMFQLCTGKKPFQAANLRQLINKILHDPLQQIPNIYSEWLRKLICQMLNKNPDRRPNAETILQQNEVRLSFLQLKQKYSEYEDMVYPLADIKTKKYCERQENMKTHFCNQTVKTAKNEQRSIRLQIDTQSTFYKTKSTKRVEGQKFIDRSLKSLIQKRKLKQTENK